MKQLNGHISITRTSGFGDDKPVRIQIVDQDSSLTLLVISMTLESFAEAVLGLGHRDCDLSYNDSPRLGKTMETKTESVFVRGNSYADNVKKRVREALAKLEVDGWEGRDDDATNHHNMGKRADNGYYVKVLFRRWVDKEELSR